MKRDGSGEPRAMGQFSADDPEEEPLTSKVAPTIVGGQPPHRKTRSVMVPAGVERVLYLAATDPELEADLLERRDAAARERGFTLHPSEIAMLQLAPRDQLQATIRALDTSQSNLDRRGFLRAVAVSAVTIAAGDALGGCESNVRMPGADAGIGDGEVPMDARSISADAGTTDGGFDSGHDAGPEDAGPEDAGPEDALPVDAPTMSADAGIVDSGFDTGAPDTGTPDGA